MIFSYFRNVQQMLIKLSQPKSTSDQIQQVFFIYFASPHLLHFQQFQPKALIDRPFIQNSSTNSSPSTHSTTHPTSAQISVQLIVNYTLTFVNASSKFVNSCWIWSMKSCRIFKRRLVFVRNLIVYWPWHRFHRVTIWSSPKC